MSGAQLARHHDIDGIIELAEHVFADGSNRPRPYMAKLFPHFLSAANLDNMYVVRDGDRVVSFLGIDLRTFLTSGCRLPSALVGAVCTHEDYAGHRYSGQTLALAYRRSRDKGAVIAWISGGRTVYLASGAARAWTTRHFRADRTRLPEADDPSLTVERVTDRNLTELVALHDRESPRFVWEADWVRDVLLRLVSAPIGAAFLVRREGRNVAAVCLRSPVTPDGRTEILDWFGDCRAVVAALGKAAAAAGADQLGCTCAESDTAMVQAVDAAGIPAERSSPFFWTLKVLDWPRLVEAILPHLADRLGDPSSAVTATGAGIRVSLAGDVWESPDEPTAVRVVFGLPELWADQAEHMPPTVRTLIERAFPVPLRHYGMNYI